MMKHKKMKEEDKKYRHIPDELLIQMFWKLPAVDLYDNVRLVCKQWARIIRSPQFIQTHLRECKPVLFIHSEESKESPARAHFLEINGQDRTMSIRELRKSFHGYVLRSCDGIALFVDDYDDEVFWIGNPITMQVTPLPSLKHDGFYVSHNPHVSFITSTGECKLVDGYELIHDTETSTFQFAVLTLGVDKDWRRLEHKFQSSCICTSNSVLSINGVVYWPYAYTDYPLRFLAMDMVEETVHCVRIPGGKFHTRSYLKMGDNLSCFAVYRSKIKLHVLKDWSKGEWNKLHVIHTDMLERFQDYRFNSFCPVAWLNGDEVLVFNLSLNIPDHSTVRFTYDVKKMEFKVLDMCEFCDEDIVCVSHTNSLIAWKELG